MYTEIQIRIKPEQAGVEETLRQIAARVAGVGAERICRVDIVRKSIDARQKEVMFNMVAGLHIDRIEEKEKVFVPAYRDVSDRETVVVVGAGPAGLFAALRLIERGFRPLVLERGKAVEDRKKDLNGLYKTGMVDEDSNFGFGEGGAGTFSDGKLYTRSKKRGDVRRVMEILVYHGANPAILVEAHPHVGTDKLPGVIVNIRKTIQKQGGEIRFGCRVTGLIIRENSIQGVIAGGQEIASRHVILATGHSARDIYRMLQRQAVRMEPKDFAVGLRLEHPQQEIDRIQYHTPEGRGKWLPAAEYNFVTNIDGRGVYSFCMCPGGYVVNASSEEGMLAVNGMSYSKRDSENANSALIVTVDNRDFGSDDVLAGIEFQRRLEKKAYELGGGRVPVQRFGDFRENRTTTESALSSNTVKPCIKGGYTAANLRELLPAELCDALIEGVTSFDRQIPGYANPDAMFAGVESRTSSPVRMNRDDKLQALGISGLYPCGEGAGYAGGITSAAVDGIKVFEAIVSNV